jgi:type 1 glutamine amidotransferase
MFRVIVHCLWMLVLGIGLLGCATSDQKSPEPVVQPTSAPSVSAPQTNTTSSSKPLLSFLSRDIKALFITGGCCHDYDAQAKVLTSGISSNASALGFKVNWTVYNQGGKSTSARIPLHENPDWAKGFDIVVHNECFADVADPEWIRGITKPHAAGVPAVVIHCAMHTYRAAKVDDWREFLGVTSYHHEASRIFEIHNRRPDHPIMKGFPATWKTPVIDELYVIKRKAPGTISLADAYGIETKENHTCIWVHEYKKARVFGVTTGHNTETLADRDYLAMISRGFLWAAGRLK